MKFKKKELLLGILLGAGVNLLNSLRAHFGDKVRERAGKKPQRATGTHGE
jgi:hypothetical protein